MKASTAFGLGLLAKWLLPEDSPIKPSTVTWAGLLTSDTKPPTAIGVGLLAQVLFDAPSPRRSPACAAPLIPCCSACNAPLHYQPDELPDPSDTWAWEHIFAQHAQGCTKVARARRLLSEACRPHCADCLALITNPYFLDLCSNGYSEDTYPPELDDPATWADIANEHKADCRLRLWMEATLDRYYEEQRQAETGRQRLIDKRLRELDADNERFVEWFMAYARTDEPDGCLFCGEWHYTDDCPDAYQFTELLKNKRAQATCLHTGLPLVSCMCPTCRDRDTNTMQLPVNETPQPPAANLLIASAPAKQDEVLCRWGATPMESSFSEEPTQGCSAESWSAAEMLTNHTAEETPAAKDYYRPTHSFIEQIYEQTHDPESAHFVPATPPRSTLQIGTPIPAVPTKPVHPTSQLKRFCRKISSLHLLCYSSRVREVGRRAADGVQVEPLCKGDHSLGRAVVCRLPHQLSPVGRDDAGARSVGRSFHAQPLGNQVCAAN